MHIIYRHWSQSAPQSLRDAGSWGPPSLVVVSLGTCSLASHDLVDFKMFANSDSFP